MNPSRVPPRPMWKVEVWMRVEDGEMFWKLLKKRGFTGSSLARTVQKSPAMISLLASGKRAASPTLAHKIAEALDVPLDLIFVTSASKIPLRSSSNRSQKKVAA